MGRRVGGQSIRQAAGLQWTVDEKNHDSDKDSCRVLALVIYRTIIASHPNSPNSKRNRFDQPVHGARDHGNGRMDGWLAFSSTCSRTKYSLRTSDSRLIRRVAPATTPVSSTVESPGCKASTVAATPKSTTPATPPSHTGQIGPFGDDLQGSY